jgi:hypothetical protein
MRYCRPFCLVVLLAAIAAPATADQVVLGFDDVQLHGDGYGLGNQWTALPDSYGGLSWSYAMVISQASLQQGYGNTHALPSGPNAVYNSGGRTVTVSSATPFDFLGACFGGWDTSDAPVGVTGLYAPYGSCGDYACGI